MHIKQSALATIVIFIAWMLGSGFVHGGLLHDDYGQLPNLFRTDVEMQKYFGWMLLAHLMASFALVWIYSRGVSASPWLGQGVRFGIVVAFLTVIPTYMIFYVVQPMPGVMVVKQCVFDGILMVVLGIIVAFMYRPKAAKSVV